MDMRDQSSHKINQNNSYCSRAMTKTVEGRKRSSPSLLTTALVAVAAVVVGIIAVIYQKNNNTAKYLWHMGPHWERFLSLYDDRAAQQFAACNSRLLTSRFGDTQVHACGKETDSLDNQKKNPVTLLFHGASDSSLFYGDWLVPELLKDQQQYVIVIDTMCDMGRSKPKDGLVKNCPKGTSELNEWVQDMLLQLGVVDGDDNIDKEPVPISLVGYSFGCYLTSQIALGALHDNNSNTTSISKLVWMAPAATVAPFQPGWLLRGLWFDVMGTADWTNWFYECMHPTATCATPFEELVELPQSDWNLRLAADNAGRPIFFDVPKFIGKEALLQLTTQIPHTLLVIGDQETLTDPLVSLGHAREVGMETRLYKGVGHLMSTEPTTREPVVQHVANFLLRK